jgi:hypothetical protein
MTATPPSRIALPARRPASDIFGTAASPGLSPSDASPSVPYPNRGHTNRSLRPSFSTVGATRRKVSRATLRGLEDLDADDEGAKLPSLVPGIRPAYSTPLPVLPMVVLCIVSRVDLFPAKFGADMQGYAVRATVGELVHPIPAPHDGSLF